MQVPLHQTCIFLQSLPLPLTPCLPLSAGVLLWVPLSPDHHRLGGSALAQCYSQLGDCCPDLEQPALLTACFNTTQTLIHGQFVFRVTEAHRKRFVIRKM